MPLRVYSNKMVHWLGAGWPFSFPGVNFHCCAACIASRAKYLLGPAVVRFAVVTFPAPSTATRTRTLMRPLIVLSALCDALGETSCNTAPEIGRAHV